MRVPFLKFGGLFGARRGKPQPTLADLDPVLADLKRREDLARAQHGNVRCIQQARRARLHKILAGEVRHV